MDHSSATTTIAQRPDESQRALLAGGQCRSSQQQSPMRDRLSNVCPPIHLGDEHMQTGPSDEIRAGEPETNANGSIAGSGSGMTTPVRNLPSFSFPVPDPTALEHQSEISAHGKYLEFLSLFLSSDRQLDIGFPKRHALIVFLMASLEKAFCAYAHMMVPEEDDVLQILCADELEPQVWRAFLSDTPDFGDITNNEGINQIRHIAVHRFDYDTSVIRAAVDEAYFLDNDTMIEEIDIILRVFYADVTGDSNYPVTDEERKIVDDLLWPPNRQVVSTHELLDKVQNLGERSSFNFCQSHLPHVLINRGFTAAECLELPDWQCVIGNQENWSPNTPEAERLRDEVSAKLQKLWTRDLRNAAAHRVPMEIFEDDFHKENRLFPLIQQVINYVRILGDEETAVRIEELRAGTTALLLRKQREWMDPSWCHTRDWKRIYRTVEDRLEAWQERRSEFAAERVDIEPLLKLYARNKSRLYDMITENDWWDQLVWTAPLRLPCKPVEEESDSGNGREDQHDCWWTQDEASRTSWIDEEQHGPADTVQQSDDEHQSHTSSVSVEGGTWNKEMICDTVECVEW
ncbi:MAG: hypothetical protein LQ338_006843 [Usnochroma carphineum]|nr:MAG: hypothetical protein LQ338_006843 [Usnochroma carphineum]